ncbi:MAG TPA: ABC transporter permease [Anaerovoracaceae bacterium]|nr:ABC transporter permease [Anaerovoracaceae bacterium]
MNEENKFFGQNSIAKYFKDNLGVLLGLVVICVIMSIASPYFMKQSNLLNVLMQISTNTIAAFGMTFVILTGGIDLSVGSIQALTGMIVAVLISNMGFSAPVAVTVALMAGLLCGLFNGVVIAKTGMPEFIVTLAMMTIARGLAYIVGDGKPTRVSDEAFNQMGAGFIGPIALPIIYMFVIMGILWYILKRTKLGRHIYAVGGNREAARFSGISIQRTQIFVFTLSGFLAGFTGVVLAARMYTGQPAIGNGAELDAIAATVLGGTSMVGGAGTLGGTLIGALVIGVIGNGLNLLNVSSFLQMVVKGLVIVFAVYLDTLKKKRVM